MPVFISHRKSDSELALSINSLLRTNGVRAYVDELDEDLKNTNDITEAILKRLKECSHLIAVLSINTQGSWWVPFEIGVATASDRRISAFKISNIKLPEYLDKWPIMSTRDHLLEFCKFYLDDKEVLQETKKFDQARGARIQSANEFHRSLKRVTGQMKF